MSPDLASDGRSSRQRSADEAYCRLRDLLEQSPEIFLAAREGLAIAIDELEARVLRSGSDDGLARAHVSAMALVDGWLVRATYRYWLLLPEAFELCEDLPIGVRDHRWESIATCWHWAGRVSGDDVGQASRLDVI